MSTLSQPPLTCLSSTLHFPCPSATNGKSFKQLAESHGSSYQRRASSLWKLKVAAKAMAEQPDRSSLWKLKVAAKAMAEQPGRSASAAVTGGNSQEESPHEKLQRLEMLLVKIHTTVEVSAKHAVENAWLVQCRDALKEAASEGDEVLAFFRQRAAMDTRATGSSSEVYDAASSGAALFFTGNALSGVEQGIRDRANSLFSGDEDTERLNVAVETLQQLSPDVAEVIHLLQLQMLPKIEQSWPATRKRPLPPLLHLPQDVQRRPQNPATLAWPLFAQRPRPPAPEGRLGRIKEVIQDEIRSELYGVAPRRPMEEWIADTPEYREYKAWVALLRRLSPLGNRIGWGVYMMLHRDMEGWGALAMWGAVLTEAERQGWQVRRDTHRYLGRYTRFDDDELPAQRAHGRERNEVHRLMRSLEMLAGDVESFCGLVALCPWDISTIR